MSRQSRARRARLWTVAGLALLSGCNGAASDVPVASTTIADGSQATGSASRSRLLAPRHTLDAAVVPVWYPFDDPPMPALLPATGAEGNSQAEGDPSRKEPIVVRPPSASGEFQRLPSPATQDDAPADARYDVDSRYTFGWESNEPVVSDAASLQPPDAESRPLDAPSALAPAENAMPQDTAPPRGVFQRLPPIEHVPPQATDEQAANRTTAPAIVRDDSVRILRPSDVLADEERPVERPTYVAPQIVERSEPIVLPPTEAQPYPGESTTVGAHPPRHREMQLINDRAAEGVRAGFALAHRGALYSAQAEFAAALRVVAQALDAQENTTRHVQALAAGLTALDESEDFLVPARTATAPVDVATVVVKHRTPVLKDAPPGDLTPIVALQRYYTFAQEQLAAAVEHEPAASQALYGMGKVQTTLQSSRTGTIADGPKAIALHQAALLVDDRNFMAANELGVLMAQCGRYDAARAALAHSVSISPQPAVWRNLAAVHDRLGETTLAANARAAAQNYAKAATPVGNAVAIPQQPVVWLDPAAFAQSTQPQADLQRGQSTAAPNAAAAASPASAVPQTSDKKSGFRWPLW